MLLTSGTWTVRLVSLPVTTTVFIRFRRLLPSSARPTFGCVEMRSKGSIAPLLLRRPRICQHRTRDHFRNEISGESKIEPNARQSPVACHKRCAIFIRHDDPSSIVHSHSYTMNRLLPSFCPRPCPPCRKSFTIPVPPSTRSAMDRVSQTYAMCG